MSRNFWRKTRVHKVLESLRCRTAVRGLLVGGACADAADEENAARSSWQLLDRPQVQFSIMQFPFFQLSS